MLRSVEADLAAKPSSAALHLLGKSDINHDRGTNLNFPFIISRARQI
jgi:hypothetical protein